MLRESSMPYSSLPQEEGEHTYVTTRTSGPAKQTPTTTKRRIASSIVILLCICGVPLMILAPLALTRGHGRSETDVTLPPISGHDNEDGFSKDNQSVLINTLPTPKPHVAIPISVIKNVTFKPLIPAPPPTTTTTTTTTSTTTTTTTTPTTTTTTTTTTTPAPATTRPIFIIPSAIVPKPTEGGGIEALGENQTEVETGTTDMPESQKNPEDVPERGGNSDDTDDNTSQTFRGMVNNLMSKHEWWTVVGLAVLVALAMAMVVITLTWIVHNRFASRRRRTNLEKVITDLQARDKVVLLNSDDSEEEA